MRFTLLLILILVAFALHPSQQDSLAYSQSKTISIKGKVVDPNGAVIPNALIVIESRNIRMKLRSNDFGEFEGKTNPGVYQLVVEAKGFCRFQEKGLRISRNQVETLRIKLDYMACGGHSDVITGTIKVEKARLEQRMNRKMIR